MIKENIKFIKDYFKNKSYLYFIEDNILNVVNINQTFKIPIKKKIDIIWIENKLNTNQEFKNLSATIEKLNLKGLFSYSTSYGIGVLCLSGFLKSHSEGEIKKVKNFLDKNRIFYKWEYSNRFLVYRFKISKSKDNLNKLKEVLKNE